MFFHVSPLVTVFHGRSDAALAAEHPGSFFDVADLPEGSYEVGPPYTEEVPFAMGPFFHAENMRGNSYGNYSHPPFILNTPFETVV